MSHSPTQTLPRLGLEGVRLGFIVGISTDPCRPSELLVDFDGNLGGPLLARSLVALTPDALVQAISTRQGAALLFERGNPGLPLVMGLIQPVPELPPASPPAPAQEPALLREPVSSETPVSLEVDSTAAGTTIPVSLEASLPVSDGPLAVRIDDQRVVLEARTELVLTCGQASISLQPDGRVIIRGTDIISHARGMNRMRGAAIQLN